MAITIASTSPACLTERREECCSARSNQFPESSRWRLGRDIELDERTDLRKLTSGPGRLAEAFGITRERDNEKDLTSKKSDLFITDDGFRPQSHRGHAAHRHHQSRRTTTAVHHRGKQIRFEVNRVGPDLIACRRERPVARPAVRKNPAADNLWRVARSDSRGRPSHSASDGYRSSEGTRAYEALVGSTILSISRVLPTNAATATSPPRDRSSTGSRVSGSTISK